MFLNLSKAYSYFKSHFVLKKTSQNWWAFDNPFDMDGVGKKKMAVHFKYDIVKCWRTGYKEGILQFIMDYEGITYQQAKDLIYRQSDIDIDLALLDNVVIDDDKIVSNVKMPDGYVPLLSGNGILGNRARNYLSKRHFDIDLLDSLGFGYVVESSSEYFGYIIIPFKKRGELKYFIGRDFIGNFLRYKNPSRATFGVGKSDLFYNEDALDLSDVVYLTEGWADALTMGREGIASMGWFLSKEQKSKILLSEVRRVVLIPDVGKEGNKTFYQRAGQLAMDFIDHKEVMLVDLSKIKNKGKDVNEIGKELVMNLITKTRILNMDTAMKAVLG